MDSISKNYELAYLISSSLTEGEVLALAGKLNKLIEDQKGLIRHVEEPKPRKLAYLIKKEKNAYFGWTTFGIVSEFLTDLEKKVKTLNFLRYLITEEEKIEIRPQPLRMAPLRQAPLRPKVMPHITPQPEEKLDLEELDKKLEEILGK